MHSLTTTRVTPNMTNINTLPTELVEIILHDLYTIWIRSPRHSDTFAFVNLASAIPKWIPTIMEAKFVCRYGQPAVTYFRKEWMAGARVCYDEDGECYCVRM